MTAAEATVAAAVEVAVVAVAAAAFTLSSSRSSRNQRNGREKVRILRGILVMSEHVPLVRALGGVIEAPVENKDDCSIRSSSSSSRRRQQQEEHWQPL